MTDIDPEAGPEQQFSCLADFVEQFVVPRFSRDKVEYRFDPDWYDIVEVRERLEQIWIDYEHSHAGNETLTGWWLFRFDPTMAVLASRYGPMRDRTTGEHREFDTNSAPSTHQVREEVVIDFGDIADDPVDGEQGDVDYGSGDYVDLD